MNAFTAVVYLSHCLLKLHMLHLPHMLIMTWCHNVMIIIILCYPCQKAIFRTESSRGFTYTHLQKCAWNINNLIPKYNIQNSCLLQILWQTFKESLSETAVGVLQPEAEVQEGVSTIPSAPLPTQVMCRHQQHTANYVCLMVESGISLPKGEDQSIPLIMEVFHSILTSHASFYSYFWSFTFPHSSLFILFL